MTAKSPAFSVTCFRFLAAEGVKHTGHDSGTDNARNVRTHRLHEQEVRVVVLKSHLVRHACRHPFYYRKPKYFATSLWFRLLWHVFWLSYFCWISIFGILLCLSRQYLLLAMRLHLLSFALLFAYYVLTPFSKQAYVHFSVQSFIISQDTLRMCCLA